MRQLKISKSITTRDSLSLEKYLHEIGKVELISAEEEVKLTMLIRLGDAKALGTLTKANLRFVVSVAKQYQNQGLSLSDLIEEGNLGLIKAAQRYDETRGFKFISYGVWWIRQGIIQAIAEQSRIVRLPLNKISMIQTIRKAIALLEQKFERAPSDDELALFLHIDVSEVSEAIANSLHQVSIDAPVLEGEDGTLGEVMINTNADSTDRELAFSESLHTEVERALTSLTKRQKEVIVLFFGLGPACPLSLEDIGAHFHVTRERIRQIKDNALTKLRSNARSRLLKGFLGA